MPQHEVRVTSGGEGDPLTAPSPVVDVPATLDDPGGREGGADGGAVSLAGGAVRGRIGETTWGAVGFCLALSGLGAYAAVAGAGFPGGAGLWPLVAGIALGGLGLGAALQTIITPQTGHSRSGATRAIASDFSAIGALGFFACAVVYVICLQLVGFLPATLVFGAGAVGALTRGWRARAAEMLAISALIVGLTLLLTMVFEVPLPGSAP